MSTKPKKEKGEEYIEKTRRGCTAKASNFLNEHVCQANKEQLTAAAANERERECKLALMQMLHQ